MPSANDDISLKKGTSTPYVMRARDISAAQDGTKYRVIHESVASPVDYGTGGVFQFPCKSGSMTAGLAADAPIMSFRWTSVTHLALLRRIRLQAWSLATGFTAGIAKFEVYRCNTWTVNDTGGTADAFSGDIGNFRTSMPASLTGDMRHSATGALTAGTRTKETNPFESQDFAITTAVQTMFTGISPHKLFEKLGSEHPMTFAQNEGFVVQATVPATGVWSFVLTPEWDEVPVLGY